MLPCSPRQVPSLLLLTQMWLECGGALLSTFCCSHDSHACGYSNKLLNLTNCKEYLVQATQMHNFNNLSPDSDKLCTIPWHPFIQIPHLLSDGFNVSNNSTDRKNSRPLLSECNVMSKEEDLMTLRSFKEALQWLNGVFFIVLQC